MGTTFTARQTGRDISAALAKSGIKRDIDAKRVRAWVRDNIDAYDDDGYTPHLYDAKTHAHIVAAMVKRYSATVIRSESAPRATAASAGRSGRVKRVAPAAPKTATAPDA